MGSSSKAGHSGAIDFALWAPRFAAGVIFLAHGGQKLLGLWGGPGVAALVAGTPEHPGMGPLGYFVAAGEFFGALALLVGLFSRFSAFWLVVIMLGAIVQVHGKSGLLMQNGGFEYNLALISMMLPTLIAGPGRYALAAMFRKLPKWLE